MREDYKYDKRVKRRPTKLDNDKQAVIWLDIKNSKLGIADSLHSQIFDLEEVSSFIS